MKAMQGLAVPALLVAAALSGPVAALALAHPAGADRPVLVIARDPDDVIARAGGRQVGPVRAYWAAIAQGGPGFTAALSESGAWAVVDADWFAALCGPQGE